MNATTTQPIETIDLSGITDRETCYLCDSERVVDGCHYCERPVCRACAEYLPQWCQFHLDACVPCFEKQQQGGNDATV